MTPRLEGRVYCLGSISRSFLGLPYRILNISHKKELLRGLWVLLRVEGLRVEGLALAVGLSRALGFRVERAYGMFRGDAT